MFERTSGHSRGPEVQKFRGPEVQRFRGLEVQKFRSSEVQRSRGSEVQRFRGFAALYLVGTSFFDESSCSSRKTMGLIVSKKGAIY
jgi:hypothetical protein